MKLPKFPMLWLIGRCDTIVPRPRRKVTLAPAASEQGDAAAAAPAGPRFHLHVYLHRTDNFDLDIKHMQEIDKVLRGYQGEQTVTLYLPNPFGQVMLEAGYGINPASDLVATLSAILGQESVVLEQM